MWEALSSHRRAVQQHERADVVRFIPQRNAQWNLALLSRPSSELRNVLASCGEHDVKAAISGSDCGDRDVFAGRTLA